MGVKGVPYQRRDPVFGSMLTGSVRLAWIAFFEARDKLGKATPCELDPSKWDRPDGSVSEDDMRLARQAARECRDCPLIWECYAIAKADPDISGVVAGQVRFNKRGRPGRAPKTTATDGGTNKKENGK